jgi:cytoskeletal protein CcmA (bactofilin family)
MDSPSSPGAPNSTSGTPEPEVLKTRSNEAASLPDDTKTTPLNDAASGKKNKHRTYRPSHKATFISLAVIIVILAVNAVVISFVLKNKSKNTNLNNDQVTISADVLSKIGVNKTSLGNTGVKLVVDPNAEFNGSLTVAGDVSISGQFKLNNKLVASDASLAKIQAGDATLTQLNVSGSTTLTDLNVRNNLIVAGATQLQGAVVIGKLLTVNNNLNVVGNVAIGGALSTTTFVAQNLASSSTLTVAGHILTGGSTPGVTAGGSALGSNGTVSISGGDTAGRIGVNIGVNANNSGGVLANVTFHTPYNSEPRVIISFVVISSNAPTCSFYVVNLSPNGFGVEDTCGLPIGGFAIDYIVVQ